MKIIHTADLHFCNKPALLADIQTCCAFMLTAVVPENPDLIVVAGDLFDEGVQLGSPASLAAIDFVYRCGSIAPVVIVRGTSTHDAEGSISALDKLRTAYPVYVADRLEQVAWSQEFGFIQVAMLGAIKPTAILSLLPSVTKAGLMALSTGSVSDTSRDVGDLMRDVFHGWGVVNDQARAAGIPTILVGHGTVTGSQLSTGQTMTGRDLEYTTGDLQLAGADLYCLGHIHKAQNWGNIFYSGSITRLNYGETEAKGFYIHDTESGSQFYPTPARSMITIRTDSLPTPEILRDVQPGDSLRICYTVNEEDIAKVDEEELRAAAIAKGAADVKIEKRIIPIVRVRAEGISREHSREAKLMKWAETTGTAIGREIVEKLRMLEAMEEPGEIVGHQYGEAA